MKQLLLILLFAPVISFAQLHVDFGLGASRSSYPVSSQLVAIVIKTGDIKDYPKKKRLLKILVDMGKYYAAYQLGFFLSYNITHQNKL